ncbi:MAG: hypothetical protein ACKO4R_16740 [Synechococcales cyanobacterium]
MLCGLSGSVAQKLAYLGFRSDRPFPSPTAPLPIPTFTVVYAF